MEYLFKWAITVALPTVTSHQIAEILLFEVVLKFGTPTRLVTDNGRNLISDALTQICRRLGITRSRKSSRIIQKALLENQRSWGIQMK
ncbi:hypothetical protein A0J61_11155 [Choanephora cucurbitarum]|uniref:Integrase catalytic domain-containing protein n=1 Tax=Choanephora cucurbitarum TaxID=101091 RepID=A0A1C7MVL0_9FUNG|nr:hypothetical protein A0J61_11155 [Choanephora cucurbitarum]